MSALYYWLNKPKHWEKPISSFEMKLICEECEFQTDRLYESDEFLVCEQCAEANERRTLLKRSEEEFNNG